MFVLEGLTVIILPRFQESIKKGELCPNLSSFELSFEMTSDILGSATGSFEFDIAPSEDTVRVSFAGVDPDQAYRESKGDEFKQPEIKVGKISPTGAVDLTFSEPFIVLQNLQLLKAKEFVIKGTKRSNLELIIEPVEG